MEGENVGLSGEDRERIQPCENCGQRGLKIAVQATAKIAHQVHVGMKAKRPGRKKPIYDAKMGDSQSTATGQWNQVEQIIDRTNTTHDESWYTKRVVTKDGEVLRDVSEPLKDHTGRGDAKPKMQE
jgi:hypothetical protein